MSDTPLDLDQVRHVARLSRLWLDEQQLRHFGEQLGSILGYVEQINRARIEGVEPMAHAVRLTNVLREDVAAPPLPTDVVLANAPDTDGPFFKVPKVLGEDDSAG
ncbi:MAG TPA: Asp-tRNA(Asn)/Glu-tRNA(Gln) amidotransferase subunit GatC [Tepidisphaeraceae bacterium]|jgi:aspartyl-tRNA(Asn)/glutamyl-tRNA(Gln) amidotransferase subunit C